MPETPKKLKVVVKGKEQQQQQQQQQHRSIAKMWL